MKWLTTLFATTVLAVGLATASQAKTLVYCSEGSPEGFDPALYTTAATFDASSKPIYNRLVEFEPGTTTVGPGLAESWTVSNDGLTYTFKLRPDVTFHGTDTYAPVRAFSADDVLFTFERQLDPDHPYYQYVEGGNWATFDGMSMAEIVASIVKIDDMTVAFNLERPYAPFLANLAMDFASILSSEYADQLERDGTMADLDRQPIGTGPFRLVEYEPDALIRYKAFDDHWAGRPALDDLIFAITVDASVRRQKLLAGACDVMVDPNRADIEGLKAEPGITVMEQPGLDIGFLAYNTAEPPFDNPRVRKALNMAIGKPALVEAVFGVAGQVAKSPIPPTMWSHNAAIEDDAYDPEAAKTLLAAEGVEGLGMTIWAMPARRPYMPDGDRVAELIQADLAAIGVAADIVSYDWTDYLERSKVVDRDGAVLLGWTGDNGDPDNFLGPLLGCDAVGGSNRAHWCNEEFEDLIRAARASTDHAERAALYREAQAVFKQDAPWATLAHSVVHLPMRDTVTGYVMDPLGGHRFDGVDIAE